ncbi:hypothetical protein GQ457_07G007800 [Hibiscus cannabinus]
MTIANPTDEDYPFDAEIERTRRRIRHRIRAAMERQNQQQQHEQDGNNVAPAGDVTAISATMNPPLPAPGRARTVRDYLEEDSDGLTLVVSTPEIEAEHFELKPMMFYMINTLGQFGGTVNEDARQHLKTFLEICNTFKLPES